jgi:hypothetical protein
MKSLVALALLLTIGAAMAVETNIRPPAPPMTGQSPYDGRPKERVRVERRSKNGATSSQDAIHDLYVKTLRDMGWEVDEIEEQAGGTR